VRKALADHGLAGFDPGRLHAHDDLPLPGSRDSTSTTYRTSGPPY
jgi:hypothetical protein